jgi:hypothetical protein
MSKSLLIVGDGGHQFTYNLVKELKESGDFTRIDVFTQSPIRDEYRGAYSNIYSINTQSQIYKLFSISSKVLNIYRYYLYRKLVKKMTEYDFVHAHFLNEANSYIVTLFKKAKRIFTFWGSDFYKANTKALQKVFKICETAHLITFTNEETMKAYKHKFNLKNEDNLRVCRFGLAPLKYLETLNSTKLESKTILGLNVNKLAITLGYNMQQNQQHLSIINELVAVPDLHKKVELIIPITYGGDSVYKERIMGALARSSLSYKVFDTYLDDETVGHIRNASDGMIQLQVSDQFSGSMQEHLFARNVVITGSWLPYETLKRNGVEFVEIDSIDKLSASIEHIIDNFSFYYKQTDPNPAEIQKLSSWKENTPKWVQLYR